jgi:hypothetical protein
VKKRLLMLIAVMVCVCAWADINIIPEAGEDPKLPEPAENPVYGEIVKVELEEDYVYDRVLATYNRTEGTFNHGWGFRTAVNYGELWQYKWRSYVLYAGDNYTVEYLSVDGNKAASSKIIVESKHDLDKALSDCFEVMAIGDGDDAFGVAGRAVFGTMFVGLQVKKYEDGEQLMNRNDDVRAFRQSFGFHGKEYIVLYDLKEGRDPQIRRVTGKDLALWQSPDQQENINNQAQTKLLKQAILSVDRNLIPADKLYVPDTTWQVNANNLGRFITPYTRVDNYEGVLTLKTDSKPRTFNGENHIKIYSTSKGEDAELVFHKQLKDKDESSNNQWDHWYGKLFVQIDQLRAYVKPEGQHSYIHYLYSKADFRGDGCKAINWEIDPELDAKITGESAYYCSRDKMNDKALRKAGLELASIIFSQSFGVDGEGCPWKD